MVTRTIKVDFANPPVELDRGFVSHSSQNCEGRRGSWSCLAKAGNWVAHPAFNLLSDRLGATLRICTGTVQRAQAHTRAVSTSIILAASPPARCLFRPLLCCCVGCEPRTFENVVQIPWDKEGETNLKTCCRFICVQRISAPLCQTLASSQQQRLEQQEAGDVEVRVNEVHKPGNTHRYILKPIKKPVEL